ncbi:hypothetical protein ON010_g10443 [Phytophthora cinnamomi]|nr:hypothetical protein ON010_g10443 [Phytophthora cinnamomi]
MHNGQPPLGMRLLQVPIAGAAVSFAALSQAASIGSPDDFLFGSTLTQDKEDVFLNVREDAKVVVDLGTSAVPLEVSWSRSLLSELVTNGAQPVVSLFGGVLPLELFAELDPPGWLDAGVASHVGDFAQLAFEEFGSTVKYWSTFDEPQSITMSYPTSTRNEAARNMLLPHDRNVARFRNLQAARTSVPVDARIGIGLDVVGGAAGFDWILGH